MAKTNVVDQPQPAAMVMPWRELWAILLVGAAVGLITYALYFLFDRYVFTPTLCGSAAANIGKCENKEALAGGFAAVIGALAGLFALVRQRTYRPLLVVLGVTIGLWGLVVLVLGMQWWLALLAMVLVFAFGYAAFSWLSQIRSFVIALILVIALVAVLRVIVY